MLQNGIRGKEILKFLRITFLLVILIIGIYPVSGQMYSEDDSRPIVIRSGLKGAVGYSILHLSDEVRPFFTTSDHYTFTPDLCIKAGAIVTVQPRFFGEHFELVFDPAFTKFSYGNYKEVRNENFRNVVDVDVESLELPLSLRYSFLRGIHKIRPYIRGGYSFSYFVDTEALFVSKDDTGDEIIEYSTEHFDYAKFQDAISCCLGVEFDFPLFDITAEIVFEKGDGLHKDKFGDSFLKISNTTSTYLQLGVLF